MQTSGRCRLMPKCCSSNNPIAIAAVTELLALSANRIVRPTGRFLCIKKRPNRHGIDGLRRPNP